MSRVLNMMFFTLLCLISSHVFAQKSIRLEPNEQKMLANNSFWTVNATCTVQGNTSKSSKVRVMVLQHGGSINGKNLSSGQGTTVHVKSNSSINVSADPGAQINLVNVGSDSLQAECSI